MSEWLFDQTGIVVYVSLFLLLMGGAIGLPIPEDIPLLIAGVTIHRGHVDPVITFIICYLGIVIGDTIIFFFGRKLGNSVQKRDWLSARFPPSLIEKTKRQLEKRSFFTILLARHLFYLRTVTFLTCGAVNMSFKKFFVADALAALVSATLMLSLGYIFSNEYDHLLDLMKQMKTGALWIALIALIGLFFYIRKRRKQGTLLETPAPEDDIE